MVVFHTYFDDETLIFCSFFSSIQKTQYYEASDQSSFKDDYDQSQISLHDYGYANQFVITVLLGPFLRFLFSLAWRCLLLRVSHTCSSISISFLTQIPGSKQSQFFITFLRSASIIYRKPSNLNLSYSISGSNMGCFIEKYRVVIVVSVFLDRIDNAFFIIAIYQQTTYISIDKSYCLIQMLCSLIDYYEKLRIFLHIRWPKEVQVMLVYSGNEILINVTLLYYVMMNKSFYCFNLSKILKISINILYILTESNNKTVRFFAACQDIYLLSSDESLLNYHLMGNNPQKPVEHEAFKSTHPLYQKAILAKQEGKNYIQARIPVQAKEYEAWKKIILDKDKPINHQFLLLPEHTGYLHDKELCSNTGTAVNNYPYYPINLAEEIFRRKPESAYFKESQLWYLLFALVAAKVDIKKHKERVGDIKPANVFIDNQRRAKVVNLLSSSKETTGFEKAKDFENPYLDSLLAPEDFPELVNNAIDNKANSYSQIFSIGVTVISAGLLDNLSSAYNYKKKQFNSAEFNALKDKWTEHPKYSEIFKSIIMNLVNENPAKRISVEDLYKFVAKYESSIKAKEQFIITHPPENLESGVSLVRSKVHC